MQEIDHHNHGKEMLVSLQRIIASCIPIPILGTAIHEVLFELPERINQNRINSFVVYLSNRIKNIENSKIDIDYLKSESFYDVTRMIFEKVIKTHAKEKHKHLANIYLTSVIEKSNIEDSLFNMFSKFIIDLHPIQISLLTYIGNNIEQLNEIGTYEKFYKLFTCYELFNSIDKYEFKYYCNDLSNKALISMGNGLDDYSAKNSYLLLENHKDSSVILTSLGFKFIEILNQE